VLKAVPYGDMACPRLNLALGIPTGTNGAEWKVRAGGVGGEGGWRGGGGVDRKAIVWPFRTGIRPRLRHSHAAAPSTRHSSPQPDIDSVCSIGFQACRLSILQPAAPAPHPHHRRPRQALALYGRCSLTSRATSVRSTSGASWA
jgi:hypothetical protein